MADFLYACIQLMHNLGAVAVVGSPAVALLGLPDRAVSSRLFNRRLAWFTLLAWSVQIASGVAFGTTTYYLKHELPDLTEVGLVALGIKVSCAVICFVLTLIYLRAGPKWSANQQRRVWKILFLLGVLALMSAAFLRWYG